MPENEIFEEHVFVTSGTGIIKPCKLCTWFVKILIFYVVYFEKIKKKTNK